MHHNTNVRSYGRNVADLHDALATARAERERTSPRTTAAWRIIEAHVRRVLPRAEQADVRQDVLIAILCALGSLRATNPASSGAWVRTICRRVEIDAHRRSRHCVRIPYDERFGVGAPLEPGAPSVEHAEAVLDAFTERVDAHLAQEHRSSGARRIQAIAALRRLALEESLPDITAALGLTVSPVLLTKWVERGRSVIVETVDAEVDRDLADFFEPLARLARERRADAGIPRPSRRNHPRRETDAALDERRPT